MGTMIQGYKLDESDYRGERFKDWPCDLKGNNDLLVLTQPQIIARDPRAYLDAGADILETNTFNANHSSQADYRCEELVHELNLAARADRARSRRRVHRADRASRASSPARSARPIARRRCRRTSTIPAIATSTSISWWRPISTARAR